MPDSKTPSDPNAPEPAPAAGDQAPPLSDSRAEAMLRSPDDEGAQPPTIISEINPDQQPMGTAPMSGASGGMWQPPSIEEAARLFPNYEVLSLLGRGGMGVVYKARQIELDRLVAIKLLPLEVSVDADFAERFRREARAMAKLNHPNIITVHDFGTTSAGHLYFAMEFVEGANLHQIIHGPGVAPRQALEIIIGVCDALHYAHGKGVVHRDIKPANVMVSTEGQVKVADFGLARLTDPAAEQLGHTMTGTVMGTPDYMAPEQMRGMNVDHRADIYSLGVMLYEMLCKDVPRGFFDPPSQRAGVDARLDDVVKRAMQQQPERRYQQTGEMRADVDGIRTTMVAPPKEPKEPKERRLAVAGEDGGPGKTAIKNRRSLFIAAAVLLVGAVVFVMMKRTKPAPVASALQTDQSAHRADATPAPAPANDEQWVDALAEWWATSPGASKGLLAREPGGSRIVNGSQGFFIGNHRDFAVRATVKGVGRGSSWHLGLRAPLKVADVGYRVSLADKDRPSTLRVTSAAGTKTLQEFAIPPGFSITDSHTMEFRAQGDLLTVLLDDQQVAQVRDSTVMEKGRGYVSSEKGALIEKFEYRELPGNAPVTRAAVSDEKWVDGLAEWWAKSPDASKGLLVKEADGSRVEDGIRGVFIGTGRDIAVRATVRAPKKSMWRIALRVNSKDKNYYSVTLKTPVDGPSRLASAADGKDTTLQEFTLPSDFDTADRHTLELRAQGDLLTVLLDGQQVAQTRDSSNTRGGTLFCASPRGSIIEKLEYRELPATTVSPSPSLPTSSSPSSATKDAPFINTLGMKFVPVPITGGPTDGKRVLFSVWETRVQDYELFAKETKREWPKMPFPQEATHPVVGVTWEDAHAFCTWLTERERKADKLGENDRYRLPSDHEWSCAAGIGDREDAAALPAVKTKKIGDTFPWGSAWPPPERAGNYASEELGTALAAGKYSYIKGELAGYRDGFVETAPVGSFAANSLGLHDLGGNAWEWCEDWFESDQTSRVSRGAAWRDAGRSFLLSSCRSYDSPAARGNGSGFRVVLSSAP